jgi:Xaa-Pro dipeptidase
MEYGEAPVSLDLVRRYRLDRLRSEMRLRDFSGLLLLDPINIRYAIDATSMQIWSMHYETRCVFVALDGPVVLFDYADHPHLVQGLPTIDEYRVMPVFYYFAVGPRANESARRFGDEIADLMHRHGGGNRRLAIDRLSHLGAEAIRRHPLDLLDGQPITEHARAIKSPEEVQLMRASLAVCQTGCQAMREALRPGITENALWARLHETNIRLGGEWVETRLLSSGPRTNPWFRECSMRSIQAGDMVSFDTDLIGPYGYCSDISRAWVCDSRPSDEQRRLYFAAFEQLEHNIALLKPGMSFREVAERSWPIPEEFLSQRYSCLLHGVGLADEYPSIPYLVDVERDLYEGTIEPGMTLCVESYIGAVGGLEGVKLEEQVLITQNSVERLSNYPFEEEWL